MRDGGIGSCCVTCLILGQTCYRAYIVHVFGEFLASLVNLLLRSDAVDYGVYLHEVEPPPIIQGVALQKIGMIIDVPWGPDEVTTVVSLNNLFSTYAPIEFGNEFLRDYPGLNAVLTGVFPDAIKVKRVEASLRQQASATVLDGGAVDSVVCTSKYAGKAGNLISVSWASGTPTGTQTAAADLTVTVTPKVPSGAPPGTPYTQTYKSAAAVDLGALVVSDPKDPFVTIAAHASGVDVPAPVADVPLIGGHDGVAVLVDWTGGSLPGTFGGLRAFRALDKQVDVLYGAEVPEVFVDDFNEALINHAADPVNDPIIVVPSSPKGASKLKTRADALLWNVIANNLRSDRVCAYSAFLMTTPNPFDTGDVVIDPNAAVATSIAATDPWISVGGSRTVRFFKHFVGYAPGVMLEKADFGALNDAGISAFFASDAFGGFIVHKGITTSLEDGKQMVYRRRYTDYVTSTLANYSEQYVESPLDMKLEPNVLGPKTKEQYNVMWVWLLEEQRSEHCEAFSLNGFSLMDETLKSKGIWHIELRVKIYAAQIAIVINHTIGTTTTFAETI